MLPQAHRVLASFGYCIRDLLERFDEIADAAALLGLLLWERHRTGTATDVHSPSELDAIYTPVCECGVELGF